MILWSKEKLQFNKVCSHNNKCSRLVSVKKTLSPLSLSSSRCINGYKQHYAGGGGG